MTLTEDERRLLEAMHADPQLRAKVMAILTAPESRGAYQGKQPETPQ